MNQLTLSSWKFIHLSSNCSGDNLIRSSIVSPSWRSDTSPGAFWSVILSNKKRWKKNTFYIRRLWLFCIKLYKKNHFSWFNILSNKFFALEQDIEFTFFSITTARDQFSFELKKNFFDFFFKIERHMISCSFVHIYNHFFSCT